MQVSILKQDIDKPLMAIHSRTTGNVYFKSKETGTCIHYLGSDGKRHISTYKTLEAVMANCGLLGKFTLIYEGDSITITF